MKLKLILGIGACLAIGILFGISHRLYKNLQYQKTETARYKNNFYLGKQKIDSLVTENGDFQYTINSLQVNINDLEVFNSDLYDKLNHSNLKIKNLENIISTQSSYILNLKDSLRYYIIEAGNDSLLINGKYKIFDVSYKDNWFALNQKIRVSSYGVTLEEYWNNLSLKQEAFQQEMNNDFDIANELIYRKKKWWQFWRKKKVTGVKSHIITDNPYLKVKVIESYKFVE